MRAPGVLSAAPDVLVVGGGVIGACTALELSRRGAAVTVLERGAELAWACSAGSAGLVTTSHAAPLANPAALRDGLRWLARPDSPFYLRPRPAVLPWLARFTAAARRERAAAGSRAIRELSTASLALHCELADAGLDTGLARRGSLSVYATETGLAGARREADEAAREGLRPQVLGAAEIRELEPAAAGPAAGGVFYPDDSHCDPLRFVRAVGAAAVEAGARVRTRLEAIGLRRRNGRVEAVSTTEGDLVAGSVVLAAGVWTPALARGVGAFVPVEGGKGYHVDLEPGPGDPAVPVWLQESHVIVTPLGGRVRIAGTLELAGLDLSISRRRVDAIVRAGLGGVPALQGRRTLEIWRGLRPLSPDGLPIVGRCRGAENLALATGHGHMGLTLAPVTGRIVGELLTGEAPSHDLGPISPDRFQPLLGRD